MYNFLLQICNNVIEKVFAGEYFKMFFSDTFINFYIIYEKIYFQLYIFIIETHFFKLVIKLQLYTFFSKPYFQKWHLKCLKNDYLDFNQNFYPFYIRFGCKIGVL